MFCFLPFGSVSLLRVELHTLELMGVIGVAVDQGVRVGRSSRLPHAGTAEGSSE